MTTNGEIQAFENFKFRIGDLVIRVTGGQHGDKGIVVARALQETTAGVRRGYTVAFEELISNVAYEEIELELWQRPVRM